MQLFFFLVDFNAYVLQLNYSFSFPCFSYTSEAANRRNSRETVSTVASEGEEVPISSDGLLNDAWKKKHIHRSQKKQKSMYKSGPHIDDQHWHPDEHTYQVYIFIKKKKTHTQTNDDG